MKNILVLGGTRFFGKKLVEFLIEDGYNITILTRGKTLHPFGEKVEHLIGDRTNKDDFAKLMEGRSFDIVFDNICYSPNEAREFCEIFNGKIKKLVFTSTLSTYDADGLVKKEEDFNPYTYPIQFGGMNDFQYGEGKRLAEAVYFKYASFPVVAVRFPIVLGEDDYTRRLHFHIEKVLKDEVIGFVNLDAEMSFIQASEAAQFLKWAAFSDVEGPYNATANGKISLSDLMKLIENTTGKKAIITYELNQENHSPYAVPVSWYMSNEKATKAGFTFSQLDNWLPNLVKEIVNS